MNDFIIISTYTIEFNNVHIYNNIILLWSLTTCKC